ncbi:MAG: GTP cyclohydrolase II [Planctomycetes bacterium]|nr:GTP cyclohydrolase II [Planctomycetota bacterium]
MDSGSGSGRINYIRLTSHPREDGPQPPKITWGAANPAERGPVIASLTTPHHRNAIGTHAGSYTLYRALAVAAGRLKADHRPDLTDTSPTNTLGPFPQWHDPEKIVSIDPYGAVTSRVFAEWVAAGHDVRPTIAITQAHIEIPELRDAIREGRLKPDGKVLISERGDCFVTKAAVEPVWYLPGIAKRCGTTESELRRCLFQHTGGMFPELVTRGDLDVFLPPIGGCTVYIFGELEAITDPARQLSVRVHDECNGSDVFGSDICTCRPYLAHGIEVCLETAQAGGAGVIVYNRKEGRGLGEVTKYLVYNARKRQAGGDNAAAYFTRTECVAGVQDVRFQELMPDVLHWLGITRIDRFVSMSNLKYDAVVGSGIEIGERLTIPDDRIPPDAHVEIDAKKAAGYYTDGHVPSEDELKARKGRSWSEPEA